MRDAESAAAPEGPIRHCDAVDLKPLHRRETKGNIPPNNTLSTSTVFLKTWHMVQELVSWFR